MGFFHSDCTLPYKTGCGVVERTPDESWVFWIFMLRLLLDFETLNKSHNTLGFQALPSKMRESDYIFSVLFENHLSWKILGIFFM